MARGVSAQQTLSSMAGQANLCRPRAPQGMSSLHLVLKATPECKSGGSNTGSLKAECQSQHCLNAKHDHENLWQISLL